MFTVEYQCSDFTCGVTLKILPVESFEYSEEGDVVWEIPPNAKYLLVGCLNHNHPPIKRSPSPRSPRIQARIRGLFRLNSKEPPRAPALSRFDTSSASNSELDIRTSASSYHCREDSSDSGCDQALKGAITRVSGGKAAPQADDHMGAAERQDELFTNEAVVGIHVRHEAAATHTHHRDALQGKYMEADGDLTVMLMTPEQRDRFAKYPSTLAIDVAQAQEETRYFIVTGLLLDSRGECTTLFHAVTDAISGRNIHSLLRRLMEMNPVPAERVRYLCLYRFESSLASEVHRALETTLDRPVILVPDAPCFHAAVEQIVKDPKMLSFIKKLQLCPDEDDFHRLMNNFRKVFGNTEEGGKFLQDFGYRGLQFNVHSWATFSGAVMIPSNFGVVRLRRHCKSVLLSSATPLDIVSDLHELSTFYARKDVLTLLEVSLPGRKSAAEEKFHRCHVEAREFQVRPRHDGGFLLRKLSSGVSGVAANVSADYRGFVVRRYLHPICNTELCQLTCPFCPESTPCMHCFQCNCETFSKLRFCSHLHVVIASHGRHGVSSRMAIRPDGAESNTDSDAAVDGGIRRGSTPSPMASAAFKRKQMKRRRELLLKTRSASSADSYTVPGGGGGGGGGGGCADAPPVDAGAFEECRSRAMAAYQAILDDLATCAASSAADARRDFVWMERALAAADMVRRK